MLCRAQDLPLSTWSRIDHGHGQAPVAKGGGLDTGAEKGLHPFNWKGWEVTCHRGSGSRTTGGIWQHRVAHGHSRPEFSSSHPLGEPVLPSSSRSPTPFVSLTPLAPSPHTSSSTGPRSAWVRSTSQAGSPGGCWQDPARVLQTWPGFVLRSARSLFLRPGQCGSNASPHLQNPQTLRKPFGNQGWGVFLF